MNFYGERGNLSAAVVISSAFPPSKSQPARQQRDRNRRSEAQTAARGAAAICKWEVTISRISYMG
jgi:3-methyladenine DNA glycosylase Mpg